MTKFLSLRWVRFNGVGAIGVAVQLITLALLTRVADLPVALATLLAVEAAILHNFAWHQRWTWRNRPAADSRELLQRLLRFHALNGTVSLVGNLAITTALVRVGLDPLPANAVAILTCSTVNFFASDRLVFRAGTAALMLAVARAVGAARRVGRLRADSRGRTEARTRSPRGTSTSPPSTPATTMRRSHFSPSTPEGVKNWRQRAMNGEVPMIEIDPPSISDGKLHHWAGGIYIPKTTVDAVVKRMQDYAGRESEFYQEVKASKLLARDGDRVRVFMRLYRGAYGMDATFNSEHAVEYRRLGSNRASSRSVSTKMAELANPGTPNEREKPAGTDTGFLWRLNAYWRFEQLGDGVVIECESVSLSRSVPLLARPFISGLVEGIAEESLEGTLKSLRKFLVR